MNNFYEVTMCFVPAFVIFTCAILIMHFFQKDKIYRYPTNEWLNLKENPIPDDIHGFIATDGKSVDYKYSISWAPHGKIYFSQYNKTYITHWMPLPDLPKNKDVL